MSSVGFWIVPLDQLDGASGSATPKPYRDEEMQSWMSRDVPALYAAATRGASAADIQEMRRSPDERHREVADTYRHLFDSGAGIKADYNPATGRLDLSNGRSRVFWGRAAGATYAPVWVRAPDERTLSDLRGSHSRLIADRHGRDLVDAHHSLTDRPERQRDANAPTERPQDRSDPQRDLADTTISDPERKIIDVDRPHLMRPGRERKEIEREQDFRFPEMER